MTKEEVLSKAYNTPLRVINLLSSTSSRTKLQLNAMEEYAEIKAVEFAEWVDKNHYGHDGDFMWFKDVNQINRKSTSELYNLFKQQQ